jgi:hypothetical protein
LAKQFQFCFEETLLRSDLFIFSSFFIFLETTNILKACRESDNTESQKQELSASLNYLCEPNICWFILLVYSQIFIGY